MNLRQHLDGLEIPSGSTKRSDCPLCGGSNSFSVTNNAGVLLFNCYRAGCTAHGATEGSFTLNDAESVYARMAGTSSKPDVSFTIPGHFKPINGEVEKYLDVKENRTVYLIRDYLGKAVDAAGRTNVKGVRPKWKRYGKSEHPYVAGPFSGIAVIVEDCISAEAVRKSGYTGIALLGTNLGSYSMGLLRVFDGAIVALDYDATGKGISITEKLSWYLPTTSVILREDLKYFNAEQIKEQLKNAREYLNSVRKV